MRSSTDEPDQVPPASRRPQVPVGANSARGANAARGVNAAQGVDGARSVSGAFSSAREARHAVRQLGLDDRLAEDVELVMSELAANAVRHARAPFRYRASADERWARVEVSDASDEVPVLGPGQGTAGRGLRIVDALATTWGTDCRGPGKVVWAELRRRHEP